MVGGAAEHTLTKAELPKINLTSNAGMVSASAIGTSLEGDYAFVRGSRTAVPPASQISLLPQDLGDSKPFEILPPYVSILAHVRAG